MINSFVEWNFPFSLNLIFIGSTSRRNFPFIEDTGISVVPDQPVNRLYSLITVSEYISSTVIFTLDRLNSDSH